MVKDVEMRDGSAGSCGKSKEIVEAQRTYYMEGKTRCPVGADRRASVVWSSPS